MMHFMVRRILAAALMLDWTGAAGQQAARRIRISPTKSVGAPGFTKPAGKRGSTCGGAEHFEISVLGEPQGKGDTRHPSPKLFWYVSRPVPAGTCRVLFTLMCDPRDKGNSGTCHPESPPIEKVLKNPDEGGLYVIDLAQWQLTLIPDIRYRWYVAIGPTKGTWSEWDVSGAFIRFDQAGMGWYDRLADAIGDQTAASAELESLLRNTGFQLENGQSQEPLHASPK